MMANVIVVIGAGQIGQAIARRVGVGNHVLLADMRPENASAAAEVLGNAGYDVSVATVDASSRLTKLGKLFGIRKVRIDGGGIVWGSFLKASVIDEISHIVVPVADGSIGTPTVFDAEQGHTKRTAKALRLKSIKRFPGGMVWLRYRVMN
jgi:riboflavin biosynthesis pyrimidine reductase